MVDQDQIKEMPKGLNSEAQAKWVQQHIKNPHQLEKINTSYWRKKISAGIMKNKNALIKAWGWVSFALQCATINKLMEDQKTAMSHEATEILWRLNANIIMFIGFATSIATQVLAISAEGASLLGTIMRTTLRTASSSTTFICSLALMGFDIKNAISAFKKGQRSLGILYILQTPVILVTAITIAMGILPLITLLTIASLGIGITIELWKDNKIQEWLARCQWGFNKQERYQNEEFDMIYFKIATAGN